MVAFHDINPQAPVHVVIASVPHISDIMEAEAADSVFLSAVFKTIQHLVPKLGLTNGFRVTVNFGKDGGQTVSHIHFHLLGGRQLGWPPG